MKQSYTLDEYNSARSVVGDTIAELGGKDSRVWLLTPDIGFGCKAVSYTHLFTVSRQATIWNMDELESTVISYTPSLI